jgi:hypothetical protein
VRAVNGVRCERLEFDVIRPTSFDKRSLIANVVALARTAKLYGLPVSQ